MSCRTKDLEFPNMSAQECRDLAPQFWALGLELQNQANSNFAAHDIMVGRAEELENEAREQSQ